MLKTAAGDIIGTAGPRFLRRKAVEQTTGLSRSTLYQYISEGRFPRPIKISARVAAWLESEVSAWMADRVAERDGAA
jgi:prophage regulatory protein